MTTNYDPKPGRWMLPLVVLAMVAFTYLFVRELPAAAGDANGDTSTTSGVTTTTTGDVTTTSEAAPLDAASQAYLETIAGYQARMTDLQTQLASANSGWDADPRTITFDQAEAAFVAVAEGASALASEALALVPPDAFAETHALVTTAVQQAADAANAALAGLRAPAPDTGEARRNAVAAFDTAARALAQAVADATPTG